MHLSAWNSGSTYVTHEIDICVNEQPGGQVYLFECKNWKRWSVRTS